ncbi:hypothetical protein ACIQVE_04090 [Pseudomonas sp. NPDC098747]|uniref:hypothetical protein n=1 Tax=Pseudomonas sp. NPDC098747 TaxID=3364487 RepID=UPI00383B0801
MWTEVNATYGPDAWDHDLEMAGGLSVGASASDFELQQTSDALEQRGLCTWLVQISKSKAKLGQIEKLLSCRPVNKNWSSSKTKYERRKVGSSIPRNLLTNKIVKLEFRLSSEERPSVGDTWQKVSEGWKPCLGKGLDDPYGFCRGDTSNFKPFKINGRECTIYPNCIEHGAVNE